MNPPTVLLARPARSTSPRRPLAVGAGLLVALGLTVTSIPTASAATAAVGLGTAAPFAVLAGSGVSNTGSSVIDGDLGVSSGSAATGFPPGDLRGVQHLGDAVAIQAGSDLTTAYVDAAGRPRTTDQTGVDLGGLRLLPGTYGASSELKLTGTVTLDAQGDPDAVFIFQAGSTLITGSRSAVSLVGSAQPCNVYWQVGSSATLGTSTRFVGTIMALTSATLQTDASLEGRVLARNGAVTLDSNRITRPGCATRPSTPAPSATASPVATPTPVVASASAGTGSKDKDKDKTKDEGKGSGGNGSGGPAKASGKGTGSGSGQPTAGQSGDGSGGSGSTTPIPSTPATPTSGTAGPGSPVPSGRPDTGMAPLASYAASARVTAPSTASSGVLLATALGLLGLAAVSVTAATRRTRRAASHRSA